jgi:hypothetical protein
MSISISSRPTRRAVALILSIGAVSLFTAGAGTQGPRFYPDDPISREPESQDASKVEPYEQSQMYELMFNLFVTSGYEPSGLRAKNINTIDEVPDSSWFTNRIGTRPITADEITKGPIIGAPPDPSKWVLIREKSSGAHPGFTAVDAKGETWFVQFDPPKFPEGATAAVAIATKIFWALGFNQVESFLTTFDPKVATIDPKATVRRPNGKRTPFMRDDMNVILENVARNPDGTYRVVAGRLLPGKVLGGYQYAGTRPDDPNDLVPHEHRRELRALRVFGAWTNLTDLKNANTVDTVITENGRTRVKHYLQDVGSTFGMCNDYHEWDLSYEYFLEGPPSRKRLFTLGFGLSPWQTVDYVEYPSVGKFEGKVFDPRKWRPQTPTAGYMEMRDDDAFWAARRVAAFTDDLIRAAVHTGQFSDPKAEQYLADVLIQRREKIKSVYLTAVNPIVNPTLDGKGVTFENAAVSGGVAEGSVTYRASWMTFDNATGATKPLSETQSSTTTIPAPGGLPSSGFVAVDIAADSATYPTWKQPVRAFFRQDGGSWKLVGLERIPDRPNPKASQKVSGKPAAK